MICFFFFLFRKSDQTNSTYFINAISFYWFFQQTTWWVILLAESALWWQHFALCSSRSTVQEGKWLLIKKSIDGIRALHLSTFISKVILPYMYIVTIATPWNYAYNKNKFFTFAWYFRPISCLQCTVTIKGVIKLF